MTPSVMWRCGCGQLTRGYSEAAPQAVEAANSVQLSNILEEITQTAHFRLIKVPSQAETVLSLHCQINMDTPCEFFQYRDQPPKACDAPIGTSAPAPATFLEYDEPSMWFDSPAVTQKAQECLFPRHIGSWPWLFSCSSQHGSGGHDNLGD